MDTKPDMWRDRPEREDRTTSFQTLDKVRPAPGVPMWVKAVIVVVLMFGFLLALKSILGW